MLSLDYVGCCQSECRYVECCSADRHGIDEKVVNENDVLMKCCGKNMFAKTFFPISVFEVFILPLFIKQLSFEKKTPNNPLLVLILLFPI